MQNESPSWGGRRDARLAFTEHGAIMAATVLNSPRAVQMSIYVGRAFARLRQAAAAHSSLGQLTPVEFKQKLSQNDPTAAIFQG